VKKVVGYVQLLMKNRFSVASNIVSVRSRTLFSRNDLTANKNLCESISYAFILASLFCSFLSLSIPVHAEPGDITLSIYTRDLMQYRENLPIVFNSGTQTFEFLQPIPRLFLSSLRVDPIVKDSSIKTITTEFLPEGIDFATLWSLHAGKMVSFQQGTEFYHGKILRATDTHIYLQPDTTQSRVEVIDKNMLSTITFDSLPLASGPSRIAWNVFSKFEQTAPVRISYLAPGANWRAAYHLWLMGDNTAKLQGSYSIENTTTRDFHNVNVELIAGDPLLGSDDAPAERTSHPGGFLNSPDEWNGYQKYVLPKSIDLPARHACQIEFLPTTHVSGRTRYVIENATLESAPVICELEFSLGKNHARALPWGEVTIYGDTINGGTFVGEDYVGPASAGSNIKVRTGVTFDITAHKERLKFERKAQNESEETTRVTISNATDRPIPITLHEPQYGSWKLLSSSTTSGRIDPSKTDATSIEWVLTIPSQSEDYVEYTLAKNR